MKKLFNYAVNAFGYFGLACGLLLVLVNAFGNVTADQIIRFAENDPVSFLGVVLLIMSVVGVLGAAVINRIKPV